MPLKWTVDEAVTVRVPSRKVCPPLFAPSRAEAGDFRPKIALKPIKNGQLKAKRSYTPCAPYLACDEDPFVALSIQDMYDKGLKND